MRVESVQNDGKVTQNVANCAVARNFSPVFFRTLEMNDSRESAETPRVSVMSGGVVAQYLR